MKKKNQPVIFLKGKRLYLRPPLRDDLPFALRWINDPDTNQYLSVYLPSFEKDEEEWLDRIQKNKQTDVVFTIVLKSGIPIGFMGLHRISWKDRTATTGALIGEEKYRNKGYGSEAKLVILEYAFQTLNLRKISSTVIAFNGRSVAYSLKCGYSVEGRRKAQFYKKGRYWDEVFLAIFRSTWLKHQK